MRILRKSNTFILGRDQAERRPVGQPQGLPGAGAAARIRRQEQGTRIGRRLGRRAAARAAAENLPPVTDLYLYQTVHLARGRARHVAEHAAALDAAVARVVRAPLHPPPPGALRTPDRTPRPERSTTRPPSRDSSASSCWPDGSKSGSCPPASRYYDGYAYRSVQPAAVDAALRQCRCTAAPTSVREAAARPGPAGSAERARGPRRPSAATPRGTFREAEGAPLFAIAGRTVLAKRRDPRVSSAPSPGGPCRPPGWSTAKSRSGSESSGGRRRRRARGGLFNGTADHEGLFAGVGNCRSDELFFTDHRGITSLSRCNGVPLMTFLAERIAQAPL